MYALWSENVQCLHHSFAAKLLSALAQEHLDLFATSIFINSYRCLCLLGHNSHQSVALQRSVWWLIAQHMSPIAFHIVGDRPVWENQSPDGEMDLGGPPHSGGGLPQWASWWVGTTWSSTSIVLVTAEGQGWHDVAMSNVLSKVEIPSAVENVHWHSQSTKSTTN